MKLKLNNVTIAFANLDEPVAKFGGEPKYSCCLLVDKETEHGKKDLENFRAIVDKLESENFDGKKLNIDKLCVSDGNEKDYDGFQGKLVFTAANKKRVVTVGKQRQVVVAGDDQFPVSGNVVNCVLDVWPLTGQFGPRIVASLEAVQYVSEGTPFTKSNVNVESDFDDLGGDDSVSVSDVKDTFGL